MEVASHKVDKKKQKDALLSLSEGEYLHELDVLDADIDHVFETFYVLEEMNQLSKDNEPVFAVLNKNAVFWTTQARCLQTSLFIGLARIFDSDPNTHSIHRVVSLTLAHPGFFSKDSLYKRRMQLANNVKPAWLDGFIQQTWSPKDASELRYLKKALRPHAKIYDDIYHPIRNTFYGHRSRGISETIKLFERTNRTELENILDFLRDLIFEIRNLYNNGSQPVLGQKTFDKSKEAIRKEVQDVLLTLASLVELEN